MNSYVRSRNGATIHRKDTCQYSRPPFGTEWGWAEGKTVAQIKYHATILHVRYRWCKQCFPELHRKVAS